MKVRYHKMETTVLIMEVEVGDINDMDAVRKEAKLMSHLHGWTKILPPEEREWVTEVIDDEVVAKNPLYF